MDYWEEEILSNTVETHGRASNPGNIRRRKLKTMVLMINLSSGKDARPCVSTMEQNIMSLFYNEYRIESNRYYRWDYSNTGLYFITIATENKIKYFGKIETENIFLSEFGKIVKNEWEKSFDIRKELFADESIIMPNHIHAIVAINNK